MSLFQVLKMERLIDLNKILEYPTSFRIDEHIDKLVSNIKLEGEIVILTSEAKKQLMRLSKSPLSSINFPAYTHVVCFSLLLFSFILFILIYFFI